MSRKLVNREQLYPRKDIPDNLALSEDEKDLLDDDWLMRYNIRAMHDTFDKHIRFTLRGTYLFKTSGLSLRSFKRFMYKQLNCNGSTCHRYPRIFDTHHTSPEEIYHEEIHMSGTEQNPQKQDALKALTEQLQTIATQMKEDREANQQNFDSLKAHCDKRIDNIENNKGNAAPVQRTDNSKTYSMLLSRPVMIGGIFACAAVIGGILYRNGYFDGILSGPSTDE